MNKQYTASGHAVFMRARQFGNIREAQNWLADNCVGEPAITAGTLYRVGLPECETRDELNQFLFGDRHG